MSSDIHWPQRISCQYASSAAFSDLWCLWSVLGQQVLAVECNHHISTAVLLWGQGLRALGGVVQASLARGREIQNGCKISSKNMAWQQSGQQSQQWISSGICCTSVTHMVFSQGKTPHTCNGNGMWFLGRCKCYAGRLLYCMSEFYYSAAVVSIGHGRTSE